MDMNDVRPADSKSGFLIEAQTPTVNLSIRIQQRLLSKKTRYQHLEIVETEEFGRLMALDGKIMLSERDEYFYHEMLVHPALLAHIEPETVVVIGGGDGGTVREVLQHSSVKRVIWAEIDEDVVAAARQYLPSVCAGVFEDPRVELKIMPGEQLIAGLRDAVDIIIVDSTDPIGPALALFHPLFFKASANALRSSGIYVSQTGTPFFQSDHVGTTHKHLRMVFSWVRLYLGFVPCYPPVWSYCMASDSPLAIAPDVIMRRWRERTLRTSYFTPELYDASAVLPRFVMDALGAQMR